MAADGSNLTIGPLLWGEPHYRTLARGELTGVICAGGMSRFAIRYTVYSRKNIVFITSVFFR